MKRRTFRNGGVHLFGYFSLIHLYTRFACWGSKKVMKNPAVNRTAKGKRKRGRREKETRDGGNRRIEHLFFFFSNPPNFLFLFKFNCLLSSYIKNGVPFLPPLCFLYRFPSYVYYLISSQNISNL